MASRSIRGTTPGEGLPRQASAPVSPLAPGPPRRIARGLVSFGDGLAYSSGLAALVGGAMTWAAGRALAAPQVPRDAALVACGAFLIYNVDRLRDLARDHPGSPGRTAFVLRHRSGLVGAAGIAGVVLVALLATTPARSVALCLAVGAIGLLHRRLKQDVRIKIAYVAGAWTAACVGLPWLGRLETGDALVGPLVWSILFVGAALTANLIASNLRDAKRDATGWSARSGIVAARAVAIAAASAAVVAPQDVAPLAWIAAAEAVALGFFRPSERFGHLAVDGALLLGALIATAQASR
jgi:hypothetical protein